MKKEFVPYKLALRLKALGFDEPCFGWYNGLSKLLVNSLYSTQINELNGDIEAPTFSQCFRFFREKYGLFGYPFPNDYQKYGYRIVEVKNPENQELIYDWGTKDTPEEAELACLLELINICKKK